MLASAKLLVDLADLLTKLLLLRDTFNRLPWLGRGWLCFKLGAEIENQFRSLFLPLAASPNEEVTIIEILRRVTNSLRGIRIKLQDTTINRILLPVIKIRCCLMKVIKDHLGASDRDSLLLRLVSLLTCDWCQIIMGNHASDDSYTLVLGEDLADLVKVLDREYIVKQNL